MNESIEQKAPKPPGLIPKHVQNYVILGVATVLIGIIWLTSGGQNRSLKPTPPAQATSDFSRLNQAKLEEYRNQLAAQERLLREQQALLLGQQPNSPHDPTLPLDPTQGKPSSPDPREALKTQLELDAEKKSFQSLFSTNLAVSYRKESQDTTDMEGFREFLKTLGKNPSSDSTTPAQAGTGTPASAQPGPLSRVFSPLYSQQALAASAPVLPPAVPTAGVPPPAQSPVQAPTHDNQKQSRVTDSYNQAGGKQYRVLEGTAIETVLLNRINSDFSGPVESLVTNSIYSHDRQRVLIPAGSKVLGQAEKVANLGQKRVSVAFHRLLMPDGFSVSLDQFKGLNQIGETALRDKVNNHYFQIFGLSAALGLVSGFSYRGVSYGPGGVSAGDIYRSGLADSLAQSSHRILDRYLNILPTVTIREGHRVKVYLTNDLILPDYSNHQMPADLVIDQASFTKEEAK
jgi:type IV secretory pathway VirB10-like protein